MRNARHCAFAAALLIVLAVIAGCGGGGGGKGDTAAKASDSDYLGGVVSPRQPAPPLDLEDYQGLPVQMSDSRGKVVLVTFIYTHCPDVCPLIVGNLKAVRARLGNEAKKLEIVAVSTDPVGDTPKAVASFLEAHAMTGRMKYLIGNQSQLERVWRRWGVAAKPERVRKLKRVYKRGGIKSGRAQAALIEHSALVYGISASGQLTTLYAANFKPAEIVHDFPRLAAS
jgi:protein SCO1/2